jgi:Fe2+ transport system protein B
MAAFSTRTQEDRRSSLSTSFAVRLAFCQARTSVEPVTRVDVQRHELPNGLLADGGDL